MAEENLNLPLGDGQSMEYHVVSLFEKIETMRQENARDGGVKVPMQVEIRTLEFWRSVMCECMASFLYVFVVCGAAANAGSSNILIATALSAGFTMTTLNQCFGHISGAHVNPAISIAMGVTKKISVLRSCMFVIAQCGGGIAGAAFLYGVTDPAYKGNLSAAVEHAEHMPAWERFGVEIILTFVVVLTYFVSMDNCRKWTSSSAVTIGAAYAACSFVFMPYLNPARSLGLSFVLNRWDKHWVCWLGPSAGGVLAGIVYDYMLNVHRHKILKETSDGDSSSIHSDEDTYDDLDKPAQPKFHGSTYNTYRPTTVPAGGNQGGYCTSLTSASLYSAPPTKLERVESLYGGTKSLYCKSPPLTRANLNRSQSVYTKSNSAINKDSTLPRPGPLVPAQSLYPMRLNQTNQSHVQNQNVQNQMQQRSENIYGVRGVTPGTSTRVDNYASTRETDRNYPVRTITGNATEKYEDNQKPQRVRPDSMYGMVGGQQRRQQSSQSESDSNYSYHSSTQRNPNPSSASTYNANSYTAKGGPSSTATYGTRPITGQEVRPSPPNPTANPTTYHHTIPQHSPNPQY